MTRDFAKPSTTRNSGAPGKKRPATPSKKKAAPKPKPGKMSNNKAPARPRALIIIAAIFIASIFATGLYFLNSVPPSKAPVLQEKQKKTPATPTTAQPSPSQKERFKFYDLLPESEVIPPKVDAYQYKEKGKAVKFEYILQTGSFRSLKDAERQRATIGFQGLKGQVEKVVVNNSSTWYRVQVGPFTSRSKMNSAMDKLVAINIQPLVKKNKK